jgi:hypothetical protein
LNEKTVLDVWKIANELECLSLKADAEQYILTHFRSLIKLDMIKLISYDLLIKIISNDDLIVDNEQQVLEAILIWFINNHEQSCEQLFDNIRFEYISKEHQKIILNQIESVCIKSFLILKIRQRIFLTMRTKLIITCYSEKSVYFCLWIDGIFHAVMIE